MPGPPPKRDSQRRRANPAAVPAEVAEGSDDVAVPKAKATWHPVAKRWFQALGKSGQSQFYEPGDWATAWMLAEAMSREFSPKNVAPAGAEPVMLELPPRAASLAAWRQVMASLLVMEGDRRRLRLELTRLGTNEAEADVSELADYRRRLQSG